MKKMYTAEIIMNDDAMIKILPTIGEDEKRMRKKINNILTHQTRYYKHKGVDYGVQGKLISFEEEHGGLKEAIITVYEQKETIKY